MKARIINWMMLMMTMFITSACSNEEGMNIEGDDFSSIMNEKNLLSDGIEIFEIDEEKTTIKCPDETHKTSLFHCYENKDELDGLYTIDETKLLNWNNKTLVAVHIFYPSKLCNFTKKVYKKDDKYVIEILEIDSSGVRLTAHDSRCFGILLDNSEIKKENILLKVGIQTLDDKGEIYYEYI